MNTYDITCEDSFVMHVADVDCDAMRLEYDLPKQACAALMGVLIAYFENTDEGGIPAACLKVAYERAFEKGPYSDAQVLDLIDCLYAIV